MQHGALRNVPIAQSCRKCSVASALLVHFSALLVLLCLRSVGRAAPGDEALPARRRCQFVND